MLWHFCFLGARKSRWGGDSMQWGKRTGDKRLGKKAFMRSVPLLQEFSISSVWISFLWQWRCTWARGRQSMVLSSCEHPDGQSALLMLMRLYFKFGLSKCSNNAPASLLTWNIFPLFQVDLVEIHAPPNYIEPTTLKVQNEWYSLPLSKLIKYHSPSPPAHSWSRRSKIKGAWEVQPMSPIWGSGFEVFSISLRVWPLLTLPA